MPGLRRGNGARAAALAGAIVMLAACTGGGPEPAAEPRVAIEGGGGDAWAWEIPVAATATRCDDPSFEINGARVSASAVTADGGFTATLPLEEGDNEVVAVCGSTRSEPVTFVQRLVHRPTARIEPGIEGDVVVLDGRRSREDASTSAAIESYRWSADGENPSRLRFETNDGPVARVPAPRQDGEYFVWLEVTDDAGRTDRAGTYFVVEDGRALVPDFDHEHPAWIERAVIYGVIPPLFGNEPFRAIERRLPYLRDLGVDALWLSPINVSPPGDFGYAVVDYFGINEDYGTAEDFRSMVQEAHRLGIRVLMDFVPNHSSIEHPYSRDAQRHGEASRHWDYYDRDGDGTPTHYFDWDYLPNLNYENPEVRRFMTEAFAYWVREFDVDGFRVDVAWGVKRRRPDYWPEWRDELKRLKPDLLLLAEASARDPYYFDRGFDVAYDWTEQVGHWAWGGAYDAPEIVAEWLDRALTAEGEGYDDDALIFRFMNNNDTDVRFVDRYGPDLTRVAAAMLLTLPGVPLVYTGDEIGASYLPYSNLTPLQWGEDRFELREYYRRLIALRHDLPALHSRVWERVPTDAGAHVFAYLRWAEDHPLVRFDGDERGTPVLVILNHKQKTDVTVTPNDRIREMVARGPLVDLLTGERFALDGPGPLRIEVPAKTALLLTTAEGAR